MRWMVMALALAGCTASHGVGQEVADWVEALDRAACERELRCEGQFLERGRFVCHPAFSPAGSAGAVEAAARGDITFDAAAAARCLDELRALPCHIEGPSAADEMTPSCFGPFAPTRGLGERCSPAPTGGWTGCMEGLHCASSDGCTGTCVAGGLPGETCEARRCDRTWCGPSGGGHPARCGGGIPEGEPCTESCGSLACIDGICAPLPTVGPGEPCGTGIALCAEGHHCTVGICAAEGTAALGEPCVDPRTCLEGLWCDDGTCALPLPAGAPCETSLGCSEAAPHCARGVCSTEALPDAPRCTSAYWSYWPSSAPCEGGLSCLASSQQCVAAVALGEACDPWTQVCVEGARCHEGRCRTIVAEGEACGDEAVCAQLLECRDGRCVALPVLGERCDTRCVGAECVDGLCTARPGGADCDADDQCQSSLCDRGVCLPVAGEGEPCGLTRGRCARGLRCFGDADDVGRCFPPSCGD